MGRVNFLDYSIDNISMEEALKRVDDFVGSGRPHQLVAVNAAKIVRMKKDESLRKLVDSCSLVFADGQAVVWASRFLGRPLKERVAGIDLMEAIIKKAYEKKYRLYFLGAREEVVRKIADIYKERYPGIVIAGWHNGYFKKEEEKDLVDGIKRLKPDILFVAMSSPRKEYWIKDNLSHIGAGVSMGVGGSFDIVAGLTKRAPKWAQDMGLEWFFRFLNEPGRLWKRYLFTNLGFISLVMREKLFGVERKKKVSGDVRERAV